MICYRCESKISGFRSICPECEADTTEISWFWNSLRWIGKAIRLALQVTLGICVITLFGSEDSFPSVAIAITCAYILLSHSAEKANRSLLNSITAHRERDAYIINMMEKRIAKLEGASKPSD